MHFDFDKNPYGEEKETCKNKLELTKKQVQEVKHYEKLQEEDLRFKITYKNILNETVTEICEIIEV